jgi:hypothetical protein
MRMRVGTRAMSARLILWNGITHCRQCHQQLHLHCENVINQFGHQIEKIANLPVVTLRLLEAVGISFLLR